MQNRLSQLICLAAVLIAGCNDSDGNDRLLPDPEGAAHDSFEQVDPHTPSAKPPADWSLPVIDAAALTALREQAVSDGKVLVIDCWASWCSPCKALFPLLHEAVAQRGDGVLLVTITTDVDRREGDDYIQQAQDYLIAQHAWEHAYVAIADTDARAELGQAASENWFGGTVPAVFVYGLDGALAFEMTQTAGDEHDQLAQITRAVDAAAVGQGR